MTKRKSRAKPKPPPSQSEIQRMVQEAAPEAVRFLIESMRKEANGEYVANASMGAAKTLLEYAIAKPKEVQQVELKVEQVEVTF